MIAARPDRSDPDTHRSCVSRPITLELKPTRTRNHTNDPDPELLRWYTTLSENEARATCAETFHVDAAALTLAHAEPAGDEEESQLCIFIFAMHADSSEQKDGDWLHDLFILPHLKNMPCEII